jgi:hypothetical protein
MLVHVKPARLDLEFYRSDTPSRAFRLRGDRTGHTPLMQIRDSANGTLLADLSPSITATLIPASGSSPAKTKFAYRGLTLEEATAIRAAENPVWDFQLSSGADVRTYLRGRVYVELDVSR